MAMTAKVKDELSRLEATKPCCRKAEVAATLRFAGGLHIVGGQIVVEAELDTANAARRLRRFVAEVYGHKSDVLVMSAGGLRKSSRYVVRIVEEGATLARQTGLIDSTRPSRPRPPAQGGQRVRVRLGGRLARCVPRPRLTHRARPVVGPRGDLPRSRGGARARRRRTRNLSSAGSPIQRDHAPDSALFWSAFTMNAVVSFMPVRSAPDSAAKV